MIDDRCTSAAVRARHRRLIDALEDEDAVTDVDLIMPSESDVGLWTTELVLGVRWASVPSEVLEAIVDEDLGVVDVSPQGRPSQLVLMVR